MPDHKFPPLLITPLKKKSFLEVVWEAVGGYVLFFGGVALGYLLGGMG